MLGKRDRHVIWAKRGKGHNGGTKDMPGDTEQAESAGGKITAMSHMSECRLIRTS